MKQKKRIRRRSLNSINTVVRLVLREQGFNTVTKVKDNDGTLHAWYTKSTKTSSGDIKKVIIKTVVEKTIDYIYYMREHINVGLFCSIHLCSKGPKHEYQLVLGRCDRPQNFYLNDEELIDDIKEWLRNNNLSISYNG